MRRRSRSVGVGLVALAILVVATLLNGWLPADDEDLGEDPFVRSGEIGDAVELREVTVTVDDVQGASGIDYFGSTLTTPGLWVVVRYTVTAADETASVTSAELQDSDGRSWRASHARNRSTCLPGPPGVPVGCVALFEVPPDAIPTLRLRLAPQFDERHDAVADIDLGLTTGDAQDFAAVQVIEVPATTLGES